MAAFEDKPRTRLQLDCTSVPEVFSVIARDGRETTFVRVRGAEHDYTFIISPKWAREFASNLIRVADEIDAKTIVDA